MRHGKYPFILAFLLPAVGLYLLYVVSPYLQAFYISMTDWSGLTADQSFVGFDNYVTLWKDEQFWHALRNNAILLVLVPTITVVLGLFLASMLNVGGRATGGGVRGVAGSAFYKVVYFFPQVLSVAIIGVMFKYVFAPTPSGGILNSLLDLVGVEAVSWLGPDLAFWSIMMVMIWAFVGFYVVLFSAAMQSIPRDVYEAAMLDGSSRLTTFRRITVPLVWDTVQVGWVYMAIEAMSVFAFVQIMVGDRGGQGGAADVLGTQLYRTAFGEFRFGRASALGVVLFFLTLIIVLLFMRLLRRERVELA